MSWRDRAQQAAYGMYDTVSSGLGLRTNTTIATQIIATGDPHQPIVGAIAAAAATAAIVADRITSVSHPDVRTPYATFTE